MNVDTGEIRSIEELTEADKHSGKWTPLTPDETEDLRDVPAEERSERLKRKRGDKKRSIRARRNAIARKSRRVNRR